MIDIEQLKLENESRIEAALFSNEIEALIGGHVRPKVVLDKDILSKKQSVYLYGWDSTTLTLDGLRAALRALPSDQHFPVDVGTHKVDLPYYIHISSSETGHTLWISWIYRNHSICGHIDIPTGDMEVDAHFVTYQRQLEPYEIQIKRGQMGGHWRKTMEMSRSYTFECPSKRYRGGVSKLVSEGYIEEFIQTLKQR